MARHRIVGVLMSLVVVFAAEAAEAELITFDTTLGTFVVRTFDDTTTAVNNFKQYIQQNLLDDSFIHLAGTIPLVGGGEGTIIWGGQYTVDVDVLDMDNVTQLAPASDTSQATLHSNVKYTITMAQTGAKTYTSGWFINMSDNTGLDDELFTAWGEVIAGRSVLDAILSKPTANLNQDILRLFGLSGSFGNVPIDDKDGDGRVQLDNFIRLTDLSVPEPASLTFLVLGGLAILPRRIA